jgi:hypothetical protein
MRLRTFQVLAAYTVPRVFLHPLPTAYLASHIHHPNSSCAPLRPHRSRDNSRWRHYCLSPSTTLRQRTRRRYARACGRSRACSRRYVFPARRRDNARRDTGGTRRLSILGSSRRRRLRSWGSWLRTSRSGSSFGCRRDLSGMVRERQELAPSTPMLTHIVATRVADCLERLLGMGSSKGTPPLSSHPIPQPPI